MFCEFGRIVLEISERHKLHDVCLHVLLVFHRVERDIISVENVHGIEIVRADSDYNDANGKVGAAANNLVNCLLHVIDDTIRDNEKDIILLIILADVILFGHVIDQFNYGRKVSWSIKIHILKGVLIGCDDTF